LKLIVLGVLSMTAGVRALADNARAVDDSEAEITEAV
jgi:hypothetical protein